MTGFYILPISFEWMSQSLYFYWRSHLVNQNTGSYPKDPSLSKSLSGSCNNHYSNQHFSYCIWLFQWSWIEYWIDWPFWSYFHCRTESLVYFWFHHPISKSHPANHQYGSDFPNSSFSPNSAHISYLESSHSTESTFYSDDPGRQTAFQWDSLVYWSTTAETTEMSKEPIPVYPTNGFAV